MCQSKTELIMKMSSEWPNILVINLIYIRNLNKLTSSVNINNMYSYHGIVHASSIQSNNFVFHVWFIAQTIEWLYTHGWRLDFSQMNIDINRKRSARKLFRACLLKSHLDRLHLIHPTLRLCKMYSLALLYWGRVVTVIDIYGYMNRLKTHFLVDWLCGNWSLLCVSLVRLQSECDAVCMVSYRCLYDFILI